MELASLIDALSDPGAYPEPVGKVEVRQTHISAVFLAGAHAYKVKKPVSLGFLDFSTLDRRRFYCDEEVRLNRRLAPHAYESVVPVALSGAGVKVEGTGQPIEWAVRMARLPDEASLASRLLKGEVGAADVRTLARRVASFHASAEGGERVAAFGRFDVVAANARDNLERAAGQVGYTITPAVLDRLKGLLEASLARLRPLIESRAARGVPRDTHGDLRLDHVYLFPGQPAPGDLVIIDCVEFNERYRCADPVADMAFLAMELLACGRPRLAQAFAEAYFEAAGDSEGEALLPFYIAYRAAVRGKVEGIKASEPEIPEAERAIARERARACWLLALGQLEEPRLRPCLALVGGLPGTGKSTLARGLAEHAGFQVIRSDVVRKELAGSVAAPLPEAAYSAGWTERTYAECLRRADLALADGGRALVDATFWQERRREEFLAMACRRGAPAVFFLCRAAPETAMRRIGQRQGDASDADWAVHLRMAESWEEPGLLTREASCEVGTDGGQEQALSEALDRLKERGLHGDAPPA